MGGRVVGDVVHLVDDELDGLSALVRVVVDRVGHGGLHVVDERHVAHGDLRLLGEERLALVLRMDGVDELLVHMYDVVECEVARAQRERLVLDVDVRVLAGVAGAVAAKQARDQWRHAPLRDHQAMRPDDVLIDASVDHVDADYVRIQRVGVLLQRCFDHVLPRMVEYVLGRPDLHPSIDVC